MLKWAIVFAVIALIAGSMLVFIPCVGEYVIQWISGRTQVDILVFVGVLLFALLGAKAISNK